VIARELCANLGSILVRIDTVTCSVNFEVRGRFAEVCECVSLLGINPVSVAMQIATLRLRLAPGSEPPTSATFWVTIPLVMRTKMQ
jgi:hypothetical protein